MKNNNISNFGYVILFDGKPNLSILLDNHDFFNDICLDSPDNIFNCIDLSELYIVGITITDKNDDTVNPDILTEDNIPDYMYNITPLYCYKLKTIGLIVEDFVDLDIINILFYDILDNYLKERI